MGRPHVSQRAIYGELSHEIEVGGSKCKELYKKIIEAFFGTTEAPWRKHILEKYSFVQVGKSYSNFVKLNDFL